MRAGIAGPTVTAWPATPGSIHGRMSQGRLDEQEVGPANGLDDLVTRPRVPGVGDPRAVRRLDDDGPRRDVVPTAHESDGQGPDGQRTFRVEFADRVRHVEEPLALRDRGREGVHPGMTARWHVDGQPV